MLKAAIIGFGGIAQAHKNGYFDSCVYGGTIDCKEYTSRVGGIFGFTGLANRNLSLNIKNTVMAGKIGLADSSSENIAVFVGYCDGLNSNSAAGNDVEIRITDCLASGKIDFTVYKTDWGKKTSYGIFTAVIKQSNAVLSANNVYYNNVFYQNGEDDPVSIGNFGAGTDATKVDVSTKVEKKTPVEMGSLTAADFSADAKLSFKGVSGGFSFIPCPTSLVPAEGWVDILKIEIIEEFGSLILGDPATASTHGTPDHYVYAGEWYDETYTLIPEEARTLHYYGDLIAEVPAEVGKDGTVAHYHCSVCGKDFDADKNLITDLKIEALEAPETTAPATTAATAATTAAAAKKSGCGSVVGFAGIAVALVSTFGVALLRKKED